MNAPIINSSNSVAHHENEKSLVFKSKRESNSQIESSTASARPLNDTKVYVKSVVKSKNEEKKIRTVTEKVRIPSPPVPAKVSQYFQNFYLTFENEREFPGKF